MSGGFETLFSTAIITIGFLSSPDGQSVQQKAYDDILRVYDSIEEAFELSITEERSVYVSALVKEALRFYPPLKLLPARQTYKDFVYQGSHIPKGVIIYVNAQAVNRGKPPSSTKETYYSFPTKHIK
jgi:phenylacetate 2-hydroxylase